MNKYCDVDKGFWDWGTGKFGCGCWVEDKSGKAIISWEGTQRDGTHSNNYNYGTSGDEGIYRFRAYSRKDAGDSSHSNTLTCYPYGK